MGNNLNVTNTTQSPFNNSSNPGQVTLAPPVSITLTTLYGQDVNESNTSTQPPITLVKYKDNQTSSNEKTLEFITWVLGSLVVVMVVIILLRIYRRKNHEQESNDLDMKQLDNGSKTRSWREIDKGCIATGKELGSGFFGVVLQGTVILDGQSKQCAVKMLKGNATIEDNKDLVNELHIIARIGHHPNIINLIGACTITGPVHIVLEFASNGNLLDYLRQNREETYSNMTSLRLDLSTKLKIAYEVAQGMRHLSSKKYVHRDLAARNVLLDEHYVAKVTGFGLSRDVYEEGIYQINSQNKMPLKWMAIESLATMMFTTQSDVWSFAVLMWEVETGGATPYPGLMGGEIFQELAAGHRLEQPSKCPDSLYELMSRCWIRDPSQRPTFQELCSELESFSQSEAGYEDISLRLQATVNEEITRF